MSDTFLEVIAKDLIAKHDCDFSNVTIVFPNKRASLFMDAALCALAKGPMWSPRYMTISELFRNRSELEIADRVKLICDLYRSYTEVTESNETLDQFYGWGELMLTDFDDVDKHIADASKVFMLLADYHELDGMEYLTDDNKRVLREFFSNFTDDHNTLLKERFLKLWKKFGEIYTNYRNRLRSQGIAYEGMLYRDVVEKLRDESFDEQQQEQHDEQIYYFIGFNLLNPVEYEMFAYLKKKGMARFYWDFDEFYMKNNHEAGRYISQHLRAFPNELDVTHETYKHFSEKKDVTYVSAPTNDIQARYIKQWLTPERIKAGRKTAIVLCDEGMLDTVIHCLPEEVKSVNITTGYPLLQAPITSLLRLIITMWQRKNYTLRVINPVLQHFYLRYISPKAVELKERLNAEQIFYPLASDLGVDEKLIEFFKPLTNADDTLELTERLMAVTKAVALGMSAEAKEKGTACNASMAFASESVFRMYTLLNRLAQLMREESLTIEMALYQRLLMQIIQLTSIPFHGEPIEGIQIMGVLETRNLDFDHLLLISCNDGMIPAKVSDTSFIPHSVRWAYGLTTIDNKVAIYSYYFHRLLQRSSDVQLAYNASSGKQQSGEMSRFMLQLLAEGPWGNNIKRVALEAGQEMASKLPAEVKKTDEMIDLLINRAKLSPSALGKYLRCNKRFYYHAVMGLKDDRDSDPDEMDNVDFGNIFHKAAELLYMEHQGKRYPKEYMKSLLEDKSNKVIGEIVDKAFRSELFKITDDSRNSPRYNGLQLINREMVITMIRRLIDYDIRSNVQSIVAVENKRYLSMPIETVRGDKEFRLGGIIDRIDLVRDAATDDEYIRIIDYKTGYGKGALKLPSVEGIFDPDNIKKHSDYFLQAFMYSCILNEEDAGRIMPGLLFIQNATGDDYSPALVIDKDVVGDIANYKDEYMRRLAKLVKEILDPSVPFKPVGDEKTCENCYYKNLCRR